MNCYCKMQIGLSGMCRVLCLKYLILLKSYVTIMSLQFRPSQMFWQQMDVEHLSRFLNSKENKHQILLNSNSSQAGLSDCCDIMLRKQVDGLALVVSSCWKGREVYTSEDTGTTFYWYQEELDSHQWGLLTCTSPTECKYLTWLPDCLQGMNDAVLQMWSREMKIMQIKWDSTKIIST